MVEFKLPDVLEGMHECEISKWLVKEGERVQSDQPIVEIQTDKVNTEITSPVTGTVAKILFAEGDVVKVGSTLLMILPEEETAASLAPDVEATVSPVPEAAVTQQEASPLPRRVIATPYVRQLARRMNIDIEQVKGTGPIGRVTVEDLHRFAQEQQGETTIRQNKNNSVSVEDIPFAKGDESVNGSADKGLERKQVELETVSLSGAGIPSTLEAEERIPLRGIRKKIAQHMVKSVTIIPHVTHVDELEVDSLWALRERLKDYAEERQVKLTFLPFFIKAIVIALKEFKTLNASIDDDTGEIILKHYYHIGIATDTDEGLIVPVIKHADRKTIIQLAEEISQLSTMARNGKLSRDQVTGGTFTISNVGPIGGLHATPIINHPEVAILALHKMEQRMVVRNGEGVIRWMMNMSLSFDHRLIDGATAVRFTNRIKQLLENPDRLLAEMT
ncbi:dihydrolipoamide S-acetyltransferase component of pyruvate dehydrogenase complex E2 [Collibacillus ludicampi]|uniref:Dihydrolipoamide acetyltransferase component of pyruvate dehydrogenase complex n=1 Tax=Collibacillus ludicampi TaxID=2771369 RepID=A0AAV4LGW3_9BACL|nr:dihydrolipoamide acetyltransferase family protein [Collibacillus ludicampi]GIM46677.1 dihydrolipoamide S-acetyltransferase component of pyruvate dehydrogenase complex E2 [Collibacillus ludicampi]